MTPGINVARSSGIEHRVHAYTHDSASASYGLEAVEKLGVDESRVFKTLVVCLDSRQLAVAVIPVAAKLSLKRMAQAAHAKKAAMAEPGEVERATGYVLGGISPLGQKKRLSTLIDLSACNSTTIFVSAGRRGLEIELSPHDLCTLVAGAFANICQ